MSVSISNGSISAAFDDGTGAWDSFGAAGETLSMVRPGTLPFDLTLDGGAFYGATPYARGRHRARHIERFPDGTGVAFTFEDEGLRILHTIEIEAHRPVLRQSVRVECLEARDPRLLNEVTYYVPGFAPGDPAGCRVHLPGQRIPPGASYADLARQREIALQPAPCHTSGLVIIENRRDSRLASAWLYSDTMVTFPFVKGDCDRISLEYRHQSTLWLLPGTHVTSEGFALMITDGSRDRHLELFRDAAYGGRLASPTGTPAWFADARVFQLAPYPVASWTPRLPAIRDMGFNVVYLCPVQSGSWYRIFDHYRIAEQVGTEEELRDFVAQAHALGLRVIFDYLPQGVGVDSPFLEQHPDWLVRDALGRTHASHGWGPRAGAPGYKDKGDTLSLDWGNPDYQRFAIDWALWYVKTFDIDGFRCDALHWKEPHLALDNPRPAWHTIYGGIRILEGLRRELKALKPEAVMLSEVWGPIFQGSTDGSYENGWILQQLNESWLAPGKAPLFTAAGYQQVLILTEAARPQGYPRANFTANHDMQPLARLAAASPLGDAVSFLHAFSKGIPFVMWLEPEGREAFFTSLMTHRSALAGYTCSYTDATTSSQDLFLATWRKTASPAMLAVSSLSPDPTTAEITLPQDAGIPGLVFGCAGASVTPSERGVTVSLPGGGYALIRLDPETPVVYDRSDLPVTATCDVAVIGGSFGGVAAALALARAGRTVTLVEPRTYLGREVAATLRPWIRAPHAATRSPLPEIVAACIQAGGRSAQGGEARLAEIPLHMDAVKLTLEDLLLQAGVKLIYASLPVGVSLTGGRIRGVILGNKSGRQVIACGCVIDATSTALVAQLTGAEFAPPEPVARYACTLEFTGAGALEGATLPVPARLGLAGDTVTVHRGYRGADHILLEVHLDLPTGGRDPLAVARRDGQARRQLAALAEHLIAEVPAFAGAYLATSSYELDGPHTTRIVGPAPAWAQGLAGVPLDTAGSSGSAADSGTLFDLAGPVGGVWCLNEAAAGPALRDPVVAAHLGTRLAQAIDRHWAASAASSGAAAARDADRVEPQPEAGSGTLQVKEQAQPQMGRDYTRMPVPASPVPVLRISDVVVVGGGTSGAVAGIVAGQEGLRTVVVDMNPGLGGTGTYGGIYTYWFGRPIGFVEHVLDWVGEMHERLALPRPEGTLARWNIEAKAWALAGQAEAAGAELLLNAYVIASIVEAGAVRGVVVATRWGPVALLAAATVDATGDGDVAAFAGADAVYGSEREHTAMYAYLPQIPSPGRPRNVKTSMLDTSNIEDYGRTLMAERRRGQPGDHDHGVYIGPRESRHIKGDVMLSFTDQLLLRSFPDVAFIAFANHDMKGESTSDWIRIGLQAPNLEIEIPYRALVPRGLDNLLVVGKAYSATHDALAGPRMMTDLENLGGVAAIAAAMALRAGLPLRDIDIRALQERLVAEGALPARVLTRTLVPLAYSDDELVAMIDALDPHTPLQSYSDADVGERHEGRIPPVDVMSAGPRAVPLLEQALERATAARDSARQVLLARMLAVLGSTAGVDVLVAALHEQLAGPELPGRAVTVRHAGLPPDQGAAPDTASLLYCLGMARDPRALHVWQRVVELLDGASEQDLLDPAKAWYYYVSYTAYSAERLGDPGAIPLLSRLHSYPPLHQRRARGGFESDYLRERLAYLELLIGRALARCGSPEGFIVLIDTLEDTRTLLAEHAHAELVAITGQDHGKRVSEWSEWLEREGDTLSPTPWTGSTEPVAAWEEQVLVDCG